MCKWMSLPETPADPHIAVYRCVFTVTEAAEINFKFSADQRAQLFLDGGRIIDGPERGAPARWYYQKCSIKVSAGTHILTSRVLALGFHKWAYAQLSVRNGFWIEDDKNLLTNWDCQIESGCTFEPGFPDWGSFPRVHVSCAHNPQILQGRGGTWVPVALFEDDRTLFAPDLPLMRYEPVEPQDQGNGVFYFPQYTCAWAEYHFSGKGKVKIRWTETPYLDETFSDTGLRGNKGKRNGKFFVGNFDIFEINSELHWFDYWWHAGHYLQILTEGDVKCTPVFHRTGYPFNDFVPSDTLEKMAFETLQACTFETYMDCPYFEQLMYIGDSRLEAIATRLITDDDRIIRKALRLFSLSQRPDGSLNAQYPSQSHQTIPSFMLIWILMLHDHLKVNGSDDLVKELQPCLQKLLAFFRSREDDGLLAISGWNFCDWCSGWHSGTPPGDEKNSIINLLYVLALQAAADITGDKELSAKAEMLFEKITAVFYDAEKDLYAIDQEHLYYSEHPAVLAILAPRGESPRGLKGLQKYADSLIPCSIYFSFYYLEVCRLYNLHDLAEKRLDKWRALSSEGLTTFPEEFGNPRSDCHAWSSHILIYLLKQSNRKKQE